MNEISSPVTDEIVERAWAAIVGGDIAASCYNASIIRRDLRTALEAVFPDAAAGSSDLVERLRSHMGKADMGDVLRDCREAADRIEALETALREIADQPLLEGRSWLSMRQMARAALEGK